MARDLKSRGWNSTGFNLSARGFGNSTSGYKASGPHYNQGISNATVTAPVDNGQRSIDGGGSAFSRLRASRSSGGAGNGNAWNALLAAYQGNGAQSYYDQMKAMAQAAYDQGMAALEGAFGEYMGALGSNLDSTKGQLLDSYNRSKKSVNDDAAQSLKQAYINKMKSERNLDQQMSAQGLSGGASESTRAGMMNNYGNARNEINTTTNKNLSALEGDYNDNLAEALQAYNSAVANAQLQKAQQQIQLQNALAQNQIAALQDYQALMQDDQDNYMNLLEKAIANGADFNFTPSQANNAVNTLEFFQTPMGGDTRTQNNLMQALQAILGQGNQPLKVNPAQNNYLAAILSQLR